MGLTIHSVAAAFRRGVPFRWVSPLVTGVAVLGLGACSVGDLLSVKNPDIVTPENLSGPAGLATLRAGALGDFALAVSGSAAGHGSTPGLIHFTSSFTDEIQYSGTFPTRRQFDERSVQDVNSELAGNYRNLHRARASAEYAADRLAAAAGSAGDARIAEMRSIAGLTYLFFGENFCSGVPISIARPTGELEFGQPLTTEQLFDTAARRFDAALAAAAGDVARQNLAQVGKGRALLDRGQFAAAAAAVAGVPTAFTYNIEHSSATAAQQNGFFALSGVDRQYSVPDGEGSFGIRFRSQPDPRTPFDSAGTVGQDGSTPFFLPKKYPASNSPVPIVTGVEARLIEAEAALQGNNPATFVQIHNTLRAAAGLPPVDPTTLATQAQRVDFHFQERGRWLWLTAQRLSDLRRLVRQYGRAPESVFPSGAYFKGGTYGPDVNFPVPIDELNNPNFKGCLNRNA